MFALLMTTLPRPTTIKHFDPDGGLSPPAISRIGDELYPGCKNKSAPPSTSESEPNSYLLDAVLSASGFFATALTTGGFGVQKSPPVFANSLGT